MENNDKNKEKILINMLPVGRSGKISEIWVSLTIDKNILTAQQIWMKYNSGSISSLAACKRIFGEILAMESQNDSENKLNNLEVTY